MLGRAIQAQSRFPYQVRLYEPTKLKTSPILGNMHQFFILGHIGIAADSMLRMALNRMDKS